VVFVNSTTIRFWWPNTSLPVGAYDIIVVNPTAAGERNGILTSAFQVSAPAPVISATAPNSVTYGVTPSQSVAVSGSNFVVGATVTIGTRATDGSCAAPTCRSGVTVAGTTATPSAPFVQSSPSGIRFYWTNTVLAPGNHPITVANSVVAGGLAATLTGGFSVSAPQPTITSVSPTPVTFGSTSRAITIGGSNFVPGATITVGSLSGTTVTGSTATATVRFVYVNSSTLRFWWSNTTLPAGSYTVTVTNPAAAGEGTVSVTGGFVVQ
jgi:hypothetical protein